MRCRRCVLSLAGIAVAVLASAKPAWAQRVRLLGGAAFGTMASAEDSGMVFEWLPGAAAGGGLEWQRGRLTLQVDGLWIQKRGRYASRGWDFKVSEVSVPLLLGIRGRGRVAPFAVAGAEIAYILSAVQDDVGGGRRVTYGAPTFDWGLVAGAGVAFGVGGRQLTLEGRYLHGLTRTMKFYSDGYDFQTRVFVLLGGVTF